jgi:hypothetical protein
METFKRLLAVGTISTLVLTGFAVTTQAAIKAPTHASSLTAHVVKTKKVAFKGSYSGTIALLWSSTGVSATSVHGTGTATLLGKSTMAGKGAGTAASTCNPFSGNGTLVGAGSKLVVKVVFRIGLFRRPRKPFERIPRLHRQLSARRHRRRRH